MPITVKFQVNHARGKLFDQTPGGGSPILQTSMRVLEESDQRLAFRRLAAARGLSGGLDAGILARLFR
jgi:hypothetical protein